MMPFPLVTVVTVVLNDSVHIKDTIQSVLSQTYSDIEYIVIDGGSTDGTLEIIRKYENQISHIISEPDKGIYDAMNKGTAMSKGEWIAYLNCGDLFSGNDVLSKIFSENQSKIDQADVIYSDVIFTLRSETIYRKARKLNSFFKSLPFSHQSHFVRTVLAKNRPFNLEYVIAADYDFLYFLYRNKARFYYFDHPISIVDANKGISKELNLITLYRQSLKICKAYSTGNQLLVRYLLLIPEIAYAMIRKVIYS